MKNHFVSHNNIQYRFKEVASVIETPVGGLSSSGRADSLTDFVQSLNIADDHTPYGYSLYFVAVDGLNFTARFYRHDQVTSNPNFYNNSIIAAHAV